MHVLCQPIIYRNSTIKFIARTRKKILKRHNYIFDSSQTKALFLRVIQFSQKTPSNCFKIGLMKNAYFIKIFMVTSFMPSHFISRHINRSNKFHPYCMRPFLVVTTGVGRRGVHWRRPVTSCTRNTSRSRECSQRK